jgi:hypothetical protein
MMKMAQSEYHGMYEYKGFTIWNSTGKTWLAEPDWDIKAIERAKAEVLPKHDTLAKAKKWIREVGVHLKEKDYL